MKPSDVLWPRPLIQWRRVPRLRVCMLSLSAHMGTSATGFSEDAEKSRGVRVSLRRWDGRPSVVAGVAPEHKDLADATLLGACEKLTPQQPRAHALN